MPHKSNTGPEKLVYRVEEYRHVSGFGRTFIYQLINAGKLKTKKVGKIRLIDKASGDALITGEVA